VWREIARLAETRTVHVVWVKSHQGLVGPLPFLVEGNEAADALATQGLEMEKPLDDPFDPTPIPVRIRDDEPTLAEVDTAIRRINDTSPGEDGIRAHQFKNDPEALRMLWELIRECWKKGDVPDAWRRTILVAIPKKLERQRGARRGAYG